MRGQNLLLHRVREQREKKTRNSARVILFRNTRKYSEIQTLSMSSVWGWKELRNHIVPHLKKITLRIFISLLFICLLLYPPPKRDFYAFIMLFSHSVVELRMRDDALWCSLLHKFSYSLFQHNDDKRKFKNEQREFSTFWWLQVNMTSFLIHLRAT